MELPTLEADRPIVVPATAEATYPHLWITNLQAHFPDCNSDGNVRVILRHYRVLKDGTKEFAPARLSAPAHFLTPEGSRGLMPMDRQGIHKVVMIRNLLTKAESNPKIAKALALILEVIQENLSANAADQDES